MGNRMGEDIYRRMIRANGLVRSFYERLKIATKSSIVNRTFITGISPVMLDDLTSGYNIADNGITTAIFFISTPKTGCIIRLWYFIFSIKY
jgi:hypothetical protein